MSNKNQAGRVRVIAGLALFFSGTCLGQSTTNMWYPSTSATFSGWPTNWVALPSLNDPKELSDATARVDFVGDALNAGAYWASDGTYFFIRMRVAVSNVTSTTFRDSHWIYIDRVGFTNGAAGADMPDYAIVWDSKNNDPSKHGVELQTGTNLAATTYWSQMALSDIDGSASTKISPPDFNLTGAAYLRTIDMQPTTNFGYTTFIDFAVNWSFVSANTALNTNQVWRLQFGSRNDANDHNFPQDDIAGGYSPGSVVASSWSSTLVSSPLSSSIGLGVYATSSGVQLDLWTADESGYGDIVVYAWIDGTWTEIGRVPEAEVVGEGSNHYTIQASGLTEGSAYLFKVVDEVGHEFVLTDPITVKAIRMQAVQLNPTTMEVAFNTERGKRYVVKVCESLSASSDQWITEYVSHTTAGGWSSLVNTSFVAGTNAQTRVRIPVSKKNAFYKIVMVGE